MKKSKLVLMMLMILVISAFFIGCSNTNQTSSKDSQGKEKETTKKENDQKDNKGDMKSSEGKKIEIITTLFPTYDFAKNIIGDKGNVTLLLNSGVEPHSYEPTPKDIVKIEESDIFVYTGDKMEPWAKSLFEGKETKFLVIDASKDIMMIEHDHDHHDDDHKHHDDHEHDDDHKHHDDHEHDDHEHDDDHKHHDDHEHDDHEHDDHKHDDHKHDDHKHDDHKHDDHKHHDDHDHDHEGNDPHIWTDPINAVQMVKNILETVKQADPENAAYYEQNANDYIKKLEELDKEYETTLKGKDLKIVYGGHFALGYMAKRYDLEYITAYEHFSPDAEPSAKKIAQIKDFVVDNNVKIIYHEEMLSPKIAKMISESTGAKSLELSGIHNVTKEDFEKGVGYIDIMKKNLYNLKEGL